MLSIKSKFFTVLLGLIMVLALNSPANAQEEKDKLPEIAEKTKGFKEIEGFFTLFQKAEEDELLVRLKGGQIGSEFLIATSLSKGQLAGLQTTDLLLKFERRGKDLLLIQPNIFFTAEGGLKPIVEKSYPDAVLARFPILAESSNGDVLFDLKALLQGQAGDFLRARLPNTIVQINRAKSFPDNTIVELIFRDRNQTVGIYFNIGKLPSTGYKPRKADERVGYFLTAQNNFSADERAPSTFERKINRWHLEKQDPSLSLSPPKEPIVFYIESGVPIKYRRWVREGIEVWNEAFEEIGFVDAIEVRQQTETNQFADFDPEDSRYNFFRWITSQRAFAIAPSRVDPRTGQILDSDILFDESMVRAFVEDFDLFVNSQTAYSDYPPMVRHWLARNPEMHPNWFELSLRYSLEIEQKGLKNKTPEQLFAEDVLRGGMSMQEDHAGHQFCSIGSHFQSELALHSLGLMFNATRAADGDSAETPSTGTEEEKKEGEDKDGEKKDENKKEEENPFGEWPEEFIGPLIRYIVAHEMGHSLGLRHNFKGSSWKTFEEISLEADPTVPTAGSVMDYLPFVLRADGTYPKSWITPTIGPYDRWAIAYGYAVPGSGDLTSNEEKMLEQIASKSEEPGLAYGTDEDVSEPDPRITRFDLAKDSVAFFQARAEISNKIMADLLNVSVQKGDTYARARKAFDLLLFERFRGVTESSKYIGGYDLNRTVRLVDEKGKIPENVPVRVIPAAEQRASLAFIVKQAFEENSIVLDPEVMRFLSAERWYHEGSYDFLNPLTYPVQDRILFHQNQALFSLLNPARVRYLYDAEFHVDAKTDLLTLPELMSTLRTAIWSEVIKSNSGSYTDRKPMVSNLRRNLQRSHLSQLIQITNSTTQSLYPSVARTLAYQELRLIQQSINKALKDVGEQRLDPYTLAHLQESNARIESTLKAVTQFGGNSGGGGITLTIITGAEDDTLETPDGSFLESR
ncbi:MAG: zinc-dependent metalloprotease [Candidatus Sumerlaeia bacterium]|nr:zinc-dependent metalloprotease [Candidatus Sumerlaeia bacterium]